MVRTLTVVIGLAMSLMAAREASAIPITPVDLDSWMGGSNVGSESGLFNVTNPPVTIGDIASDVFFDGSQYTYVHTVTSHVTLQSNSYFATAFSVAKGLPELPAGASPTPVEPEAREPIPISVLTRTRVIWLGL